MLEDVLDQHSLLNPLREEYAELLDKLIRGWVDAGQMSEPAPDADFFERLEASYIAGCDWFQPMDISLPGDRIHVDTPMHFSSATFELLTCPAVLDIVEQLIGGEITSNPIQHVRLKPPSTTLRSDEIRAHISNTAWHQDRGVTHADADGTDMVTVWMAITDATIENGCLQVIPNCLDTGLLPHCPKTQTAIADGYIDLQQARPLPVGAGGIVLFHPLTPHASLDNRSERFRWSFDVRYSRSGQPTGRAHFPDFIVRSRASPETELRDWREWRRMWEQARARLPRQQHIPTHRWAASSPECA